MADQTCLHFLPGGDVTSLKQEKEHSFEIFNIQLESGQGPKVILEAGIEEERGPPPHHYPFTEKSQPISGAQIASVIHPQKYDRR